MTHRDWQLSEPAKIVVGSLTEETLDERFFRVPTASYILPSSLQTSASVVSMFMAGRQRSCQRLPLGWQCIQRRDIQLRFDSHEQLPEPNDLEAVQACNWSQLGCE